MAGGSKVRGSGSGGRKSPSRVQGQSPGRGSGGRSPPKAEALSEKLVLIFIKNNCKIVFN